MDILNFYIGKCSICGKGLTLLEGYSDNGKRYCDKCWNKEDNIPIKNISIQEKVIKTKPIEKKKEKENFKQYVSMGKWNFIFTYWVVRWGMLSALMFILFSKFILEQKIDNSDVIFNIIIWGICGLIAGILGWKNINKKLKEE